MVIGHTIDEGWKRSFIFSFHMPLFIMCSGHFFNKNEKIKTTIKKVILKLINQDLKLGRNQEPSAEKLRQALFLW